MAKPIDLTPKITLVSYENETLVEIPTQFSDFFGGQSMNTPTVVRQNHIESANFISGSTGWRLDSDGSLEAASVNIVKGGDIRMDQDLDEQSEIIWHDTDGNNDRYRMFAEENNGDFVITPTTDLGGRLQLGLSATNFATVTIEGGDEIVLNSTEIFVGAIMKPDADNTRTLGIASARWSDVRSVLINGADIGFASGWKFREYPASKEDIGKPDQWFKENANLGIQLLDEDEKVIAVFHKNGTLYVNDIKPLKELIKQKQ